MFDPSQMQTAKNADVQPPVSKSKRMQKQADSPEYADEANPLADMIGGPAARAGRFKEVRWIH